MEFPREYPKMLAVAAVVQDAAGNVLLHKRESEPDQGKWQLFATYVRPGERLVEAVKRRLLEDGGIVQTRSVEFTGEYSDEPGRHAGTFCIPFIFKVLIDTAAATKMQECRWFTKEEALQLELALDNHKTLQAVA